MQYLSSACSYFSGYFQGEAGSNLKAENENNLKAAKRIYHHLDLYNYSSKKLNGSNPIIQLEEMVSDLYEYTSQKNFTKNELQIYVEVAKSISCSADIWKCYAKWSHASEAAAAKYDLLAFDKVNTEKSAEMRSLIIEKLKNLPINGKLIVPGGPFGHALVYEICRQNENHFSFKIMNTGDGVGTHTCIRDDTNHIVEARTIVYNDLSIERVTDVNFLRILFQYAQNRKGTAQRLYAFIDRKLNTGDNRTDGRKYHIQNNGVCSYKSLGLALHELIAPETHTGEQEPIREKFYQDFKLHRLSKDRALLDEVSLRNYIQQNAPLELNCLVPSTDGNKIFDTVAIALDPKLTMAVLDSALDNKIERCVEKIKKLELL
jgi:hypothetical protein